MVHHLLQSMKQTIREASWMDDETKIRGQEKLEKIAKKIAYPDYIFNETRILQDFNGVSNLGVHRIFEYRPSIRCLRSKSTKPDISTVHYRLSKFHSIKTEGYSTNSIIEATGIVDPLW